MKDDSSPFIDPDTSLTHQLRAVHELSQSMQQELVNLKVKAGQGKVVIKELNNLVKRQTKSFKQLSRKVTKLSDAAAQHTAFFKTLHGVVENEFVDEVKTAKTSLDATRKTLVNWLESKWVSSAADIYMGDRKLAKHLVAAMKALQRSVYFSVPSGVREKVYSRQEVALIDEDETAEGLSQLGLDKAYEGETHDGRGLIMDRMEDFSAWVEKGEETMDQDTLLEDGLACLYVLEKELD